MGLVPLNRQCSAQRVRGQLSFLPIAVLADVAFDNSNKNVQPRLGPQLRSGQLRDSSFGSPLGLGQLGDVSFSSPLGLGQLRDVSFGSFLGVADPVDNARNCQDGFRELADLLLLLSLHLAYLLDVGSELSLLFKDELHGVAHFFVGHLLPHAGILI